MLMNVINHSISKYTNEELSVLMSDLLQQVVKHKNFEYLKKLLLSLQPSLKLNFDFNVEQMLV